MKFDTLKSNLKKGKITPEKILDDAYVIKLNEHINTLQDTNNNLRKLGNLLVDLPNLKLTMKTTVLKEYIQDILDLNKGK